MEINASMINPENDDFWDADHLMQVTFKDGTEDDFPVPYLWCFMEREEVVKFVIEYNELEDVDMDQTGAING